MTPVPVPDDCPHSWKHGQADVTCLLCGASKGDHRLPVPVVNEVAEAIGPMLRPPFYDTLTAENQAFWDAGISRQVEHFLAVPAVAAAFEARAKLAELQAAPSGSKDLELAEAQAKLEAERARVVTEIVAALRDSKGWIEDDAYADWVQERFLEEGGESS